MVIYGHNHCFNGGTFLKLKSNLFLYFFNAIYYLNCIFMPSKDVRKLLAEL